MKYKIAKISLVAPFSCSASYCSVPFVATFKGRLFHINHQLSLLSKKTTLQPTSLFYRNLKSYIATLSLNQLQTKLNSSLHKSVSKAISSTQLLTSLVKNFCLLLGCQKSTASLRSFLAKRRKKALACSYNLQQVIANETPQPEVKVLKTIYSQLLEVDQRAEDLQKLVTSQLLASALVFNSAGGLFTKPSKHLYLVNKNLFAAASSFQTKLCDLQTNLVEIFAEAEHSLPHVNLIMNSRTNGDLWLQAQLLERKVTLSAKRKRLHLPKVRPQLISRRLVGLREVALSTKKSKLLPSSFAEPDHNLKFFNLKVTLAAICCQIAEMNSRSSEAKWQTLQTVENNFLKLAEQK